MSPWVIYILKCPRTLVVKYVGVTIRAIDLRFEEHFLRALKSQKTRRDRGILSLLSIGLMPLIEAVEHGTGSGFKAAEQRWIAFYRAQGIDLWNETSGGQGTIGWGNPELFKARADKMRATRAAFTPEERAAISAKISNAHTPEEWRAIARKRDASYTPEQLSAARAKSNAPKWRAARSAANKKWRANQTAEERSAVARKGAANTTPETKRAAVAKRLARLDYRVNLSAATTKWQAARTPEQRSASAKEMHAKRTPEQRSAILRKANANRSPEQRRAIAFAAQEAWRKQKAVAQELATRQAISE